MSRATLVLKKTGPNETIPVTIVTLLLDPHLEEGKVVTIDGHNYAVLNRVPENGLVTYELGDSAIPQTPTNPPLESGN